MSRDQNERGMDIDSPCKNSNYLATIKANIKDSSSDLDIIKSLRGNPPKEMAKFYMENYLKTNKSNLETIQATFLDKIIFGMLNKQKLFLKNYLYIFYVFFIKEYYYEYCDRSKLGHRNFEKFFKKFFNSCMKNKENIFTKFEIGEIINLYVHELFKFLTENDNLAEIRDDKGIENLKEQKENIINPKDLKQIEIKYMKNLVKYTLAFCNILNNNTKYKNYHVIIFQLFMLIEDKIFNEYFKKQLYKIYIKKGVYKYGDNFVLNIFYPLFYLDNKKSQYQFNFQTSNLTDSILSYRPKYCINENNKNINYDKNTPYHFLNIVVLIKIMRDLLVDEKHEKIMLNKLLDFISCRMNLFIDDDNQIRVAELILIDTVNNKLIMNSLDKMQLIKHYFQNFDKIDNNKDYFRYFHYLFIDLSMDTYMLSFYENNNLDKKKNNQRDESQDDSYVLNQNLPSQELIENSFMNNLTNNNLKNDKNDINQKINDIFIKSNDCYIKKYFQENIGYDIEVENSLNEKNIPELFILLDIIYNVSYKFIDKIKIKNAIQDVQKIIRKIMEKCSEKKQFNCAIYNFVLSVDEKYIPLTDEFDIINCNYKLLFKESPTQFIKTYPLYIIFILNYWCKNNYDFEKFIMIIEKFITGYSNNAFDTIDKKENGYSYILQFNYLSLIYLIIEIILYIHVGKINEENINDNTILHLPYCIFCQKKMNNNIILGKYLSQCIYCGEKYLYVNTNLKKYLFENKKHLENICDKIISVELEFTLKIMDSFIEKHKNQNETSLYCHNLFYKIMEEHFQFLNKIKYIIGEKDFISKIKVDENESLADKIRNFLNKFVKNKNQCPIVEIYNTINNDDYEAFNTYRKAIKHESNLAKISIE